jgi:release factor glutamine methyltransferase
MPISSKAFINEVTFQWSLPLKNSCVAAKSNYLQQVSQKLRQNTFLHTLLGISRMDLHNPVAVENALTAIGDTTIVEETFWKLLDRRCAHEPLQYLTGVAYFRHLELKVGPGVLVPRPESELLVEAVLSFIEKREGAISVVDLGAGSGALALAIATEAPQTHVIAVEKSPAAIEWLKENVSFIDEKVRILESDVAYSTCRS